MDDTRLCVAPGRPHPATGGHLCQRGDRCEAAEPVRDETGRPLKDSDGKPIKQGAPSTRYLCDTCERAAATTLTDVPQLYFDLENALPPGATPSSTGGSRPKITGSPLGVNGRAVHLQEVIYQLLTVWEDAIRDTAGLTMVSRQPFDSWERTSGRARAGGETQRAAQLLSAYLTAWTVHGPIEYAITRSTADPDDPKAEPTDQPVHVTQAGWEAAAELIEWKHRVRAALGVTNPPLLRPEPCMYCEVRAIVEISGDEDIRCENCHRRWTREEYRGKVRGFEPYLRKLAKSLRGPAS